MADQTLAAKLATAGRGAATKTATKTTATAETTSETRAISTTA